MNQFWLNLLGVAIPLAGWTGWMIWWMSGTTSDVKSLKEGTEAIKKTLERHIQEDKMMQEQIQALAVNEANVAGTLSTFALEIKQIRQYLEEQHENNGEILELKLSQQTSALINKFRDMLEAAKIEWVTRRRND